MAVPGAGGSQPAKLLCLMRHAKSSWADPELPDFDRPLAPRGEKSAARMAVHLQSSGIGLDLILSSTARRARQTAAAVSSVYPDAEVTTDAGIYGATVEELMERVRTLPEDRARVIIVGHNPGIQELALTLSGHFDRHVAQEMADAFPTGAVATLAGPSGWAAFAPGSASLLSFATPRRLA